METHLLMKADLPVLYHKDGIPKDVVEIGEENPWGLKQGDMVRIEEGSFTQLATVVLLAGVSQEHVSHVTSSKWTGESGRHGYLQKLTLTNFILQSIKQSSKMKLGLVCAVSTIVSAFLAAALAKDGTFNPHLGGWCWVLFGVTISATLVGWIKDLGNLPANEK